MDDDISLNVSSTPVSKNDNDESIVKKYRKKKLKDKKTQVVQQFKAPKNKNALPEQSNEFPENEKNLPEKRNKSSKNTNQNYEKPSIIEKFKKEGFPLFNRLKDLPKVNDTAVATSTEEVFATSGNKFQDLNIHPHTVVNLERIGQSTLTAVQEKTIPVLLSGKNALVRSQTGSGKTLAYALPIVELLQRITPHITRADGVQALIVVPTRELALQTHELFMKLIEPFRWIVPGRLCGGEKRNGEKARIRKGINILVGTPGRLLDHMMHTDNLKLDNVKFLVLDEADRLLDMGFQKDVNKIVQLVDHGKNGGIISELDSNDHYDPMALIKNTMKKSKIGSDDFNENSKTSSVDSSESPSNSKIVISRQTILLSATLTNNVKQLASFAMDNYAYIDPMNAGKNNIMSDMNVVVPESVRQMYMITEVKAKLVVLSAFIIAKSKKPSCKIFVFMASRQMVEFHETLFNKCLLKRPADEGQAKNFVIDDQGDNVSENIDALDIKIYKLHGSMDQKQRTEVFKSFQVAKKAVLICTDVAARGVDIPATDYVVQYTGPSQDEDYIHRVGRTGRAGYKGHSILFLTEFELGYIDHLRDKQLNLRPENQDDVLKHLKAYMGHMEPAGMLNAAEALQKRYERAILNNVDLKVAACLGYTTWSRFYSCYCTAMKKFFDFKNAHLGHYVTSFGLRMSPQEVGRFVNAENKYIHEKTFNKNLTNHEEAGDFEVMKTKKRSRTKELLISEFDSGMEPVKKKKKVK